MWLQNVYTTKNVSEQGLSLALAVTEHALKDTERTSAYRVHGGGFAGTIQAFVPAEDVASYKAQIETVFGANSCSVLRVRPDGAVKVL
jgi:galactokinase